MKSTYSKYKDSGIEWLGKIPESWTVERLQDISNLYTSNVNKKSVSGQKKVLLCNYVDVYYNNKITSKIDFMKATASDSEIKKFKLNEGDVIITKDSETPFDIGVPTILTENINNLICGYHLSIIKGKENILDGTYLFYALRSKMCVYQFSVKANGVTRFGLSQSDTKNIKIAIPDFCEQRKIAEFLDNKTEQIDLLIKKKEELIDKLKEQRISLITNAVTGKINISTKDTKIKYKDSGIKWLGKIPEHWNVSRLKFLASCNDEILTETTSSDKMIKYVDISSVNLEKGICNIENTSFKKAPSRARRKVKDGDIIISTVRTYLKAIAGIYNPPSNLIVSTGFAVIRPSQIINPKLLSYISQSQFFINEVMANSTGVSYPAINPTTLISIPIVLSTNKCEQRKIAEYLDEKTERIDTLTES